MRNALSSEFGVELPPSLALDYPSAEAIAAHINSLLVGSESEEQLQLRPYDSSGSDYELPEAGRETMAARQSLTAPGAGLGGRFAEAASKTEPASAVAIVGMSARYPGSVCDTAMYWSTISKSTDLPSLVRTPVVCERASLMCGWVGEYSL